MMAPRALMTSATNNYAVPGLPLWVVSGFPQPNK